ncbi:unnamed protein product [Pleuronectes platessa]|uniref:Uncharacterized protein n=1 Tax=Pleuronectes platessa TaxID=8262 RepID=A0A9N7Z524_PLEPL|nr:unnamed protein product [Pleuronectes platessa]
MSRRQNVERGGWPCHDGLRHRVGLDWHMLGRVTGVGDDGGLPCDAQTPATRNPWKLGQTLAWLCLKPPNPHPTTAQCWFLCKFYWKRRMTSWAFQMKDK